MFLKRTVLAGLSGLALVLTVEGAQAGPQAVDQTMVVAAVATGSDRGSPVGSSKAGGDPSSARVKVANAGQTAIQSKSATRKPKRPARKPRPKTTLKLSIDLSRQRMVVRENGRVRHTFKISSGRAGYRTPTGTWRPKWMTRMHYSRKYDNAPMPHSIFFHGGYAIHATYATGRLGRPASHGCIRLSPGNAKKVYRLVQKHSRAKTLVKVHGVAPKARAVARKKTRRTSTARRSAYRKPRQVRRKRSTYKKTYSYVKPSYGSSYGYGWPGDPPRRRLRYGY